MEQPEDINKHMLHDFEMSSHPDYTLGKGKSSPPKCAVILGMPSSVV